MSRVHTRAPAWPAVGGLARLRRIAGGQGTGEDLDSIGAVEAAPGGYDGALLVVSHDRDFLAAIGVEREVALA